MRDLHRRGDNAWAKWREKKGAQPSYFELWGHRARQREPVVQQNFGKRERRVIWEGKFPLARERSEQNALLELTVESNDLREKKKSRQNEKNSKCDSSQVMTK